MAFLVAFGYLLVVISCIQGVRVPFEVKVRPEHKIFVRSTPSLDPAEELLEKFGNENQMNLTDMETLFKSVGLQVLDEKDEAGNDREPQVYI